MTEGQPLDGSKAAASHSITRQDLAQAEALVGSGRSADLSAKEDSSVLQKLQKWADYQSYGEPVGPTRFLPMKTPMSSEIIQNWSLDEPPQHVLTIQSLLKDQQEKGRTIGLIIDLSNHETLYADDLQAVDGIQYTHIPVSVAARLHSCREGSIICLSMLMEACGCAVGGEIISSSECHQSGHQDCQELLEGAP